MYTSLPKLVACVRSEGISSKEAATRGYFHHQYGCVSFISVSCDLISKLFSARHVFPCVRSFLLSHISFCMVFLLEANFIGTYIIPTDQVYLSLSELSQKYQHSNTSFRFLRQFTACTLSLDAKCHFIYF
jgi:hypothetical protein